MRAKKGRHVIKQEIQGVKLKSLVVTWILKSIFEGKKKLRTDKLMSMKSSIELTEVQTKVTMYWKYKAT